ncbi:MAG: hypothetical protein ABR548_13340 [Actinomycetota bacterium]|nr:hypothetical protein [Actinomycetota bacterium]
MNGPASVMSLVLTEITVGSLAVLWSTPAWGHIRRGFFKLIGSVIVVAAVLGWFAARAPLGGADAHGSAAVAFWLLGATAGVAVLWQILLWAGFDEISRVVGIGAVPVGIAALVALASLPATQHSIGIGIAQLLTGALFLGAVTDGLLLGHWYLVDRRASRSPLARMGTFFLAGSALMAAATIAGGGGGGTADPRLSPLLGAGSLTVALAVGLAVICALIGFFIRALVKEDSIQAATGFFYLAVIMAIAAEFAAKVRFF